jgi:hypothetical protein
MDSAPPPLAGTWTHSSGARDRPARRRYRRILSAGEVDALHERPQPLDPEPAPGTVCGDGPASPRANQSRRAGLRIDEVLIKKQKVRMLPSL